jgi:hypothetical protein
LSRPQYGFLWVRGADTESWLSEGALFGILVVKPANAKSVAGIVDALFARDFPCVNYALDNLI